MEIGPLVSGISKLADYAASGIGSVAGPMLASWKARREANAKLIAAKGEVEAQRILAEGQAHAIQIIASAQADARAILVSPDATVQGQLDFGAAVTQRIQFQEEKRQSNIMAVVQKTALEIGEKEVQDHEVDHDWTARFFNDVQDVSSEEMQRLWAKILAGEVEKPGSTSFRAMDILRGLERTTAILFRTLCSARMTPHIGLREGGVVRAGNEFVLSLDGRATGNSLNAYGLGYTALNRLNEHGLVAPGYDSELQHMVTDAGLDKSPRWISIAHGFQGRSWVLTPIDQRQGDQTIMLRVILLTNTATELARVVDIEPMPEYQQAVADFFEQKGFHMLEIDFGTSNTP